MNIQRKNSAHHFRMQSEREQTLVELPQVLWKCNSTNCHLCFTITLVSDDWSAVEPTSRQFTTKTPGPTSAAIP